VTKKIWNKSPLSCSHRHAAGCTVCPDCGSRLTLLPLKAVSVTSATLTEDDFSYGAAEERAILAARARR
jgi:hypothetical protein